MALPIRKVSRQVAHAEGRKRFYTGEACIRGHYAERFVANGNCVDCASWKTPPKRNKGGSNTGMAPRAFVFQVAFRATPEEIHAAFLYMEANRWHDAALQAVHDDPALLARYAPIMSTKEAMALTVELERREAVLAKIRKENE